MISNEEKVYIDSSVASIVNGSILYNVAARLFKPSALHELINQTAIICAQTLAGKVSCSDIEVKEEIDRVCNDIRTTLVSIATSNAGNEEETE